MQIRDYIKQATSMMDNLNKSSDPVSNLSTKWEPFHWCALSKIYTIVAYSSLLLWHELGRLSVNIPIHIISAL